MSPVVDAMADSTEVDRGRAVLTLIPQVRDLLLAVVALYCVARHQDTRGTVPPIRSSISCLGTPACLLSGRVEGVAGKVDGGIDEALCTEINAVAPAPVLGIFAAKLAPVAMDVPGTMASCSPVAVAVAVDCAIFRVLQAASF